MVLDLATCLGISNLSYLATSAILIRRTDNPLIRFGLLAISVVGVYFVHVACVHFYWEAQIIIAAPDEDLMESLALQDGANKLFHAIFFAPFFVLIQLIVGFVAFFNPLGPYNPDIAVSKSFTEQNG